MNMMHITRKLDDSKTALMVKNGRFYWELGSQNDMIE